MTTIAAKNRRINYRLIAIISGVLALVFILLFATRIAQRLYARFTPPVFCAAQVTPREVGTWTEGTPLREARAEIAGAALDNDLYVASGFVGQWQIVTKFESYDIDTKTWSDHAPVPIQLHHASIVALDGDLILTGGYNHDFDSEMATAWRYSPASDTWAALPDMPYRRAAHASSVLDGKLYVIGGDGEESLTVMVYDPAANTWDTSSVAPMPGPARDHLHSVVLDGMIYLIGGRTAGVHTGVYDSFERYNPATNEWQALASMTYPTSSMAVGVLNGQIHVAGGEDIDGDCVIQVHEMYDPETDTWSAVGHIPTPRHGLASAVIDNTWYIAGGSGGAGERAVYNFSSLLEIFTPASS